MKIGLRSREHDCDFSAYLRQFGYPDELMNPHFNAFVCGGAWRSFYMGEPPKDIDVFCTSRGAVSSCRGALHGLNYHIVHSSPDAIVYQMDSAFAKLRRKRAPIHLVSKVHGKTLPDILGDFDFNICMFGTDFRTDYSPVRGDTIWPKALKTLRKQRSKSSCASPVGFMMEVNNQRGSLRMLSHFMRLRSYGFRLQSKDYIGLIERAGMEIAVMRAAGTDPASLIGQY